VSHCRVRREPLQDGHVCFRCRSARPVIGLPELMPPLRHLVSVNVPYSTTSPRPLSGCQARRRLCSKFPAAPMRGLHDSIGSNGTAIPEEAAAVTTRRGLVLRIDLANPAPLVVMYVCAFDEGGRYLHGSWADLLSHA